VSVYVLTAIVSKRLDQTASLYEMLHILSLTLFEKTPLHELLTSTVGDAVVECTDNQLILFE
jgi:hypothetical protein